MMRKTVRRLRCKAQEEAWELKYQEFYHRGVGEMFVAYASNIFYLAKLVCVEVNSNSSLLVTVYLCVIYFVDSKSRHLFDVKVVLSHIALIKFAFFMDLMSGVDISASFVKQPV